MDINAVLKVLRSQTPLVHCVTNCVAMNVAANITLAAGASPAMIHAHEEVADFTPIANQATSVAGVAQRTGSTIYYVEMLPDTDATPVFALAPSAGDVDILIAAEVRETGRVIMRGFIAPGRTSVITSTHRQLATQEKIVPGNGTADTSLVLEALQEQAEVLHAFNMLSIAEEEGTVISAALFCALAGSGELPFEADSFRHTLCATGRGVDRSLAAFERAFVIASGEMLNAPDDTQDEAQIATKPVGPEAQIRGWKKLDIRLAAMHAPVRILAEAGLRKVIEFQDIAYGESYLSKLEEIQKLDDEAGGDGANYAFKTNAAKYLANAMRYDDIVRVAAAKTQQGRIARIEVEVQVNSSHLIQVTEYAHPGAGEVVSLLPARFGQWLESGKRRMRLLDRMINKGRLIRTDRLSGFLLFYILAGLQIWRRGMLRHKRETEHMEAWLTLCLERLPKNYALAVQKLKARRLIKGYSDKHARGHAKFGNVVDASRLVEDRTAGDWIGRLIDAALSDPSTKNLDGAIATIRSFATEPEKDLKLTA